MKRKIKIGASLLALALLVSVSGCGCKKQTAISYRLNLEVWGLFDDRDVFAEAFDNYIKSNSAVKEITYRKFSPETYKKELIDALAAGQGPDIFLIHNTWLPGYQDKLVAAPAELVTEQEIKQKMVDTVSQDFLKGGKFYALPLSVDSLALFYNKDIFNRAGITSPPTSWREFSNNAALMTTVDKNGNITQSGAAIGTAYNINRSTDILNLLILQNQEEINKASDSYYVNISSSQAENALKFYTQFANSSYSSYSWNPRMHYSVDAFSEGNLAMMLNYSWQIDVLKNKAPKLNFGTAPVPQLNENKKTTYSNYWGFGVAKNKTIKAADSEARAATNQERIIEAWKFLKYLTLPPATQTTTTGETVFDPALDYLTKTQKPSARRDLIEKQKTDVNLGAFALGNLYARAWTQYEPASFESIMAEAIENVVYGKSSAREALTSAESKINNIIPSN